jgi:Chaperone of endosialidase
MNINRVIVGLIIAVSCCGTAVAQTGNTKYGTDALASNSGISNSAFGDHALFLNTGGSTNSAFGDHALYNNTDGGQNTAIGSEALLHDISHDNTAVGEAALYSNTLGTANTANGVDALYANTAGNENTAIGYSALSRNGGSNNIGIGVEAGYFAATGSNNIEIGNAGLAADTGVIRIGTQGTQRFTQIAGISGVHVTGGAQVLVNARGQLGVASSSIRYKENVNPMGDASDKLFALRPVTFQYKEAEEDGSKPVQYGLIAEEVDKVMPDLVVYNEQGQPETVAYQTPAPLLLNELQKAHKQMEQEHSELQKEQNELQKEHMQIEQMQAEINELRKAH